jgi:hypothetical protein
LADPVRQIIGGWVAGFAAGITGYAIDLVIGAMFEAFKPINPLFGLYGIIYATISFLSGLSEAYYAGFFFSFGVISAGFLLNDFVIIVSGFMSIGGVVIGIYLKNR